MPLIDLYPLLFVSKIVSTIVYADGIRVYAEGEGGGGSMPLVEKSWCKPLNKLVDREVFIDST